MWIPVTPRVRGAFQILSVLCISLLAAGIVWADNRQPEVECHDIGGFKYVELDLSDGVGSPESPNQTEVWTVTCPDGATPCPQATGSLYTPYHNGEHGVDYVLYDVSEGIIEQCSYHLNVGPPGFQAELEWEWDVALGPSTVDLDIHLHQPSSTEPWGGDSGTLADCAWDNCRAWDFDPASPDPLAPHWFSGIAPPDPMNWYLSPVFEENTCIFMPQGGSEWQMIGLGCHNPRLSLDNVTCNPFVTDPNDADFCHLETVNIDFMPLNEWTRVGVHYYSNQGQTYDVHPKVKFYCHRKLVVELGDQTTSTMGFSEEVTFTPSDSGDLFWIVADVLFLEHPQTSEGVCIVRPLFSNSLRSPYFTTVSVAQTTIGPSYAEVPIPLFWDSFDTGDTSAWSVVSP